VAGGTHPSNHQNSCFCNFDCPPTSKPFRTYAVNVVDLEWPLLNGPKYFEIETRTSSNCIWKPNPLYTDNSVQIQINPGTLPGFDFVYHVEVFAIDNVVPRSIKYVNEYGWNESDLPIDKNAEPGCNAIFSLTADVPRLAFAFVNPIPEWICDQEQLEEWLP